MDAPGQVAHRSADADEPPGAARFRDPGRRGELLAHVGVERLEALGLGLAAGQEALVSRTAPSSQERIAVACRSSTRTSCMDPPPMSSVRPVSSVVEFTAAR
jgi:hypothetical protein